MVHLKVYLQYIISLYNILLFLYFSYHLNVYIQNIEALKTDEKRLMESCRHDIDKHAYPVHNGTFRNYNSVYKQDCCICRMTYRRFDILNFPFLLEVCYVCYFNDENPYIMASNMDRMYLIGCQKSGLEGNLIMLGNYMKVLMRYPKDKLNHQQCLH